MIETPEVPTHWRITKLGFVASVRARLGWKGLKAEEYLEDGYVFLSTPNIKYREIDFENVNYISQQRYFESPEIMLRTGDVLIAKDGSTLGISNVVKHLPRPSTVNSSVAVIRPTPELDGRYLNYFFQSHRFQATIQEFKGGMGVPHLFQADLRKFQVLLPPIPEQQAIADFLDQRTGVLDSTLSAHLALFHSLQSLRSESLDHFVSKGEPTRFRFCVRRLQQGWSPECEARQAGPDEWGVLKVGCVNGHAFDPNEHKALPSTLTPDPALEIRPRDLLMSRANTRELAGSVALVREVRPKLLLCDKLYRIHLDPGKMLPEYAELLLTSTHARRQLQSMATGASDSMQNISQQIVLNLLLPIPSLAAQRIACEQFWTFSNRISGLTARIERQMALLREYRQSLITAAVTGQIDVTSPKLDAVCP